MNIIVLYVKEYKNFISNNYNKSHIVIFSSTCIKSHLIYPSYFIDFEGHKNCSCNVLWILSAFCIPIPGQRANVFGCACINSLNVPKVDKRVVASVLLTDRIVVKAFVN